MLELLPAVPLNKREEAARLLVQPSAELPEIEALIREVLSILHAPIFAALVQPGSMAEVKLTGFIGGKRYAGQVDRMVVLADEILLVDYKTNRKVPETHKDIPEAYLQQMAIYTQLLKQIYPQKTIRSYLFWTAGPTLMPLENQLLARYVAVAA
jgi:ATP-dependent helicase/nuclease subunit A